MFDNNRMYCSCACTIKYVLFVRSMDVLIAVLVAVLIIFNLMEPKTQRVAKTGRYTSIALIGELRSCVRVYTCLRIANLGTALILWLLFIF